METETTQENLTIPHMPDKTDHNSQAVLDRLSEIPTHLQYLRRDVTEIKQNIELIKQLYVTQVEFGPIKNLVYGMVGLILVAVIGGLVALVIK